MSASFFDCMIVSNGHRSCHASDLYTKKDPFISRPQSMHNLSQEEQENAKNQMNNPNALPDGKDY